MRARHLLPIGILLVACVAGSAWRWYDPFDSQATGDTAQYARVAYRFAGDAPTVARLEGLRLRCTYWRDVRRVPNGGYTPAVQIPPSFVGPQCVARSRPVTPADRRYEAIFDARVAYPALVASTLPLFGRGSFVIWTIVLAIAAGILVAWVCRLLGGGRWASVAAALAAYVLPTGLWATRLGPEGGMYAGTLLAVGGAVLLDRQVIARWKGMVAVVSGIVIAFLFKPADGIAVGAALALAAAIAIVAQRAVRAWRPLVAAAVTTVACILGSSAFGAPGLAASLDDTFSRHYQRPLPAHPWHQLWRTDVEVLRRLGLYTWPWFALLLAVVGIGYAVARAGLRAVPVAMLALVAVVVVLAHPVTSELPRLVAPLYLAVAVGLGLLTEDAYALARRRRRASTVATAGTSDASAMS